MRYLLPCEWPLFPNYVMLPINGELPTPGDQYVDYIPYIRDCIFRLRVGRFLFNWRDRDIIEAYCKSRNIDMLSGCYPEPDKNNNWTRRISRKVFHRQLYHYRVRRGLCDLITLRDEHHENLEP